MGIKARPRRRRERIFNDRVSTLGLLSKGNYASVSPYSNRATVHTRRYPMHHGIEHSNCHSSPPPLVVTSLKRTHTHTHTLSLSLSPNNDQPTGIAPPPAHSNGFQKNKHATLSLSLINDRLQQLMHSHCSYSTKFEKRIFTGLQTDVLIIEK